MIFYQAQNLLAQVLGIAALAMQVFAFVDAARFREDAYRAAGKMTKSRWLVILGIAMAIGFIFVLNVFNMFSLIAIVAAAVYLADVRPALQQVMGNSTGRRNNGPYGPW